MRRHHFTAGHMPLTHEPEVACIGDIADENAIDDREDTANDEAEDAEYDAFLDDEDELEESL